MKRLMLLSLLMMTSSLSADAQPCPSWGCPLPGPGAYMPIPQRPYNALPRVTRDPYYRPVPPGVDLYREYHNYGGGPQRMCPSPRGPIPC